MKLSKKAIISIVSISIIFILSLIIFSMYINISNNEIRLRQRIHAQQKANEAVFDNMWKILQQQAQVTDQYKESFMKIYPDLIRGRYSQGDGSLMKWITESNPNFDVKLYDRLMINIEAQRNIFTNNQKMLIDMKREHDIMLTVFPNNIFIGGRERIPIKVITSEKTEQVFNNGKENEINLFK